MLSVPLKYNKNLTTSYYLHDDPTAPSHQHVLPGPTKWLPGLPVSFPDHSPLPVPHHSLFSTQHPEWSYLTSHTMPTLCSKPSSTCPVSLEKRPESSAGRKKPYRKDLALPGHSPLLILLQLTHPQAVPPRRAPSPARAGPSHSQLGSFFHLLQIFAQKSK